MSWLAWIAMGFIVVSAAILIGFLIRRPPLTLNVKIILMAGLGVLPIGAALAGNVANFEVTKQRAFCGSCHPMWDYTHDAADDASGSLAAAHTRLPMFGDTSCYNCHSDYGMFGTVTTKIGGMKHVWAYYSEDWDDPGHPPPKLYKPFSNKQCQKCHALKRKPEKLEHRVHEEAIKNDDVRCAGFGCHRPPHPACATWHKYDSPEYDPTVSATSPAPSGSVSP